MTKLKVIPCQPLDELNIHVISCNGCPFIGPTDGEAASCCHPVHPYRPKFGAVEVSEARAAPPPPECPLRQAAMITRVYLESPKEQSHVEDD